MGCRPRTFYRTKGRGSLSSVRTKGETQKMSCEVVLSPWLNEVLAGGQIWGYSRILKLLAHNLVVGNY